MLNLTFKTRRNSSQHKSASSRSSEIRYLTLNQSRSLSEPICLRLSFNYCTNPSPRVEKHIHCTCISHTHTHTQESFLDRWGSVLSVRRRQERAREAQPLQFNVLDVVVSIPHGRSRNTSSTVYSLRRHLMFYIFHKESLLFIFLLNLVRKIKEIVFFLLLMHMAFSIFILVLGAV